METSELIWLQCKSIDWFLYEDNTGTYKVKTPVESDSDLIFLLFLITGAAILRCFYKKVFWKYAANLQEKTHAKV